MNRLTVRDCLCPRLLRVEGDQRYRDVVINGVQARVFTVYDEGRYLGMVTEKQAALFPSRIFADLVVLRQPPPLSDDADLALALDRIHAAREDFLPVTDARGDILGAVSQTTLFACLSHSEQVLREEREELIRRLETELENRRIAANVFESTSEGILVTDADNRIRLVNRAFTETTGYSLDEVAGQPPGLLSSGRHDATFYAEMWRAIDEQGRWSGEVWNRRKNGEIYPEWLHINAIRDSSGNVANYVGIFSDITHHKDVQRRLHRLAYYDALTDLPNRQLFYDRLEQAIVHARRDGSGFSLLFIDLDRFKDVNDSLGHGFGDRLLVQAARRLREAVRESDTVARLGGDEFTVILADDAAERDTATVAMKVIDAFSRPLEVDERRIFLSASVGIGRFPDDGDTADTLVRGADTAMYRAKEEGRARYCFYTPALNQRVSERLELENALRAGLRQGELYLAWQPQVRLSDGAVIGLEALARWRHPRLGEIPPARFIPVAEEGGLILDLGAWVLEQAARGAALVHQRVSGRPPRIAVNISALQVRHRDAVRDILAAIDRHGLSPGNIELEITESALMSREHSAEAFLSELGDRGVLFAVDDFGTGYSNLAYLKRFAVHRLKIDQTFVRDLAEDEANRRIVTAIVGMAHGLGIRLIAEGVETAAQRDILIEIGCEEAQGYLFGRPQPLETLLPGLVGG